MASSAIALSAITVLGLSSLAYADTLQDTIADSGTGVTLEAGSSTAGTADIRVIGNNAAGDPDSGCNIDPGEAALVLNIITPAGVTANPNPLSLTSCGTDVPVSFTASSAAVSGRVTVTVKSGPAGGGTYVNQVDIPITITQPAPTNTKPTVTLKGVTNGASYEIGAVPTASCSVVDPEDGDKTTAATLTGSLSNGLGSQTATCTYTDSGTPALSAVPATATYTVVDTGKPTIEPRLTPGTPNGNGWYNGPVRVEWLCADGGSGLQDCSDEVTLDEGANQSPAGTAVDWQGNTATSTVTPSISIDRTLPTIDYTLDPTSPNADGWYGGPVRVDFTCDDALSGIDECTGDATLADGADQLPSGTAKDAAGNTASKTVETPINVDGAAPTVDYTLSPAAPNANGWYKSPVAVDFLCDDALSGIKSCLGDVTLEEGLGQQPTGNATDKAGNTAAKTVDPAIDIDTTKPTIEYSVDPAAPHSNGWYNAPVTVDFQCADTLSGIGSCAGDATLRDGAGQEPSGTATDLAGNTVSAKVSSPINVDSAAPTIRYTLSPAAPNANGWYNSSVDVDFICADTLSGVDECTGDTTLAQGVSHQPSGMAKDLAGNTATAQVSPVIHIDTTKPTVAFTTLADNATYSYGNVPGAPGCQASDDLSGFNATHCVIGGDALADFDKVGTHTYTATAADKAGNSQTVTLTYTVSPWTRTGFTSPVDMGGVWNTVKGGSTVPLKFEVFAGATELTSTSVVKSFTTTKVACTSSTALEDAIEVVTTGGTALRYSDGQFIQNWQTPKMAGSCYQVVLTTQDGGTLKALFKLK